MTSWHTQNITEARYNYAFLSKLHRLINLGGWHYTDWATWTRNDLNVPWQEAA
jgi:hypothetical protein